MNIESLKILNQDTHKYQSFIPPQPVYIISEASVVGPMEGEGPLGKFYDIVGDDNYFGCDNWEDAESTLIKRAVEIASQKAGITEHEIRIIFAGDLLAQSIASNFGLKSFPVPVIGVYGACSACGLSFFLSSMALTSGIGDYIGCVTSSHFGSVEKEFRFPSAYGNQRPLSTLWTVTGGGAFILSNKPRNDNDVRLTGFTTGQIVDYGLNDSLNMGACMAPAAADTIYRHFRDFETTPQDYDKIITGDLGKIGQQVLWDLMKNNGRDISECHIDCGIEIYDAKTQDVHSGGSGCGCCAVTLAAYIIRQIRDGKWKKVLFVPTGALLSKISHNEGKSVPGIAHAVVLEGSKV